MAKCMLSTTDALQINLTDGADNAISIYCSHSKASGKSLPSLVLTLIGSCGPWMGIVNYGQNGQSLESYLANMSSKRVFVGIPSSESSSGMHNLIDEAWDVVSKKIVDRFA